MSLTSDSEPVPAANAPTAEPALPGGQAGVPDGKRPERSLLVRIARAVLRIPDYLLLGWLMIGLVRLYQIFLSPIFGRQCRFHPTCSHYFIGAVKKDGAVIGACRGLFRILRCNPWCPGGWDPP